MSGSAPSRAVGLRWKTQQQDSQAREGSDRRLARLAPNGRPVSAVPDPWYVSANQDRSMAQEGAAGSRIFISYRREDAIAHVNALFTPLRNRFGEERVFKDTDNIAPGQDFTKVIQSQLKTCSVLLAVIGKHWLTAKKPKSDIRRIDDPHDYLRVEIVTALRNDSVLVIPILVGDATMPTAEDLPEDLVPLSYRNGFELRDSRWESDVTLLIRSIEKACGEPAEASPRPAPRLPEPRPATGEKPPVHERGGLDRLAARRTPSDRGACQRRPSGTRRASVRRRARSLRKGLVAGSAGQRRTRPAAAGRGRPRRAEDSGMARARRAS